MTNLIHTSFILQYIYYNPLLWCTGWERTLNVCSGRPLPESDDTRCCINTISPLMMSIYCSKHIEDYNKRIV